jgi:glycosyltransferase involved in cell wall biosynthesis
LILKILRSFASPLARSRSAPNGILVVDDAIPAPDRDAGSRTIFQLLQLMRKHRLAVHFWALNRNADGRDRELLEDLGVAVGTGDRKDFRLWMRKSGPTIGAVLLSRPVVAEKALPIVRRFARRAKVTYYGHDIHHRRLRREIAQGDGTAALESSVARHEKIENEVWAGVDAIFYPSDEEVLIVTETGRHAGNRASVHTLPVFGYDDFPDPEELTAQKRSGLFFVGGFNHRPNVSGVLWFVETVLPRLLAVHPDIVFTVAGSHPPESIRSLASANVVVTGHVTDEELARHYRAARVAVAPLLFGAGMKGKVVEAMHFGLPIVTTSTGAQGLSKAAGRFLVADDPAAQAASILHLLDDDHEWEDLSQASLAFAREHFSADAMWVAIEPHLRPDGT